MQVYAGMVGVLFKLEAEHGRIDVIWGIVIWIECWRKTTVPCESRTGLCWQFYAHWLHPRLWKIDRWTVGMRHTTFISVEVVTILAVMFIRVGHSVWQACWANLSVSELHDHRSRRAAVYWFSVKRGPFAGPWQAGRHGFHWWWSWLLSVGSLALHFKESELTWFDSSMPMLKSSVCCNATCYKSYFIIDRHSMFIGRGPAFSTEQVKSWRWVTILD